jgi:hypothetical protein
LWSIIAKTRVSAARASRAGCNYWEDQWYRQRIRTCRAQDPVARVEVGEHALVDQVATNGPTGASVAGTKPIVRSLL